MINLSIVGDFSDNQSFSIFVNGKRKLLDGIDKEVVFELEKPQNYKIKIVQNNSFNNHNIIMVFLFAITAIIQGIVNIFLQNTDSKWYRNITPFIITTEFDLLITADKTLVIKYINGNYDENQGIFLKPVLYCNNKIQENCSYDYNYTDFYNQYFVYVKRVLSVGLICEIVNFVLFMISLHNQIFIAMVICSIVFVALLFLQLLLLKKEFNLLKNLLMVLEK